MESDGNAKLRGARMRRSLLGLAVGDALGAQFFVPANIPHLRERTAPEGPWPWTDDTEMACSIAREMIERGNVNQRSLAESFAQRHDFDRGYGPAMNRLMRLIREGGDWEQLSSDLFDGQGSWGNGAAMRVAPLGAWFAGEPDLAANEAALSASTTHRHEEAIAGAIAVAVLASLASGSALEADLSILLEQVASFLPPSDVKSGIQQAASMSEATAADVARELGCGRQTSARDTVPFCLWSAVRHIDDFERAFWETALVGGDVDTTCAIVGGIVSVAPNGAPPAEWLANLEPLPEWATGD